MLALILSTQKGYKISFRLAEKVKFVHILSF